MSLYLLIAIVVLFLLIVILFYRSRMQQAERAAKDLKTTNDVVSATLQHRKKLDDDLSNLQERHRAETLTEQARLADRADFDNDWNSLPDGTGYVAPNSGATAADPSGIAGDRAR